MEPDLPRESPSGPPQPAAGDPSLAELRRQLAALQLDLDVEGALHLVRALQAGPPLDLASKPEVDGLAERLLRGLATVEGQRLR